MHVDTINGEAEPHHIDLTELADAYYGARTTLKLDDGRLLRCTVEIDDIPASEHINGAEVWGKVSEYAYDYTHDSETPRPEGFDGNAEKIQVDRGYWMWWQPPKGDSAPGKMVDGTWQPFKRGSKEFADFRQSVRDLLESGFYGVVLELCNGTDAYGQPIVVDVASLWGIDSLENGYLLEVITELAGELDI